MGLDLPVIAVLLALTITPGYGVAAAELAFNAKFIQNILPANTMEPNFE